MIGIGAAVTRRPLPHHRAYLQIATLLLLIASILATIALSVFRRPRKPAKTLGVSPSFPAFVRGAYVWLLIAAALAVYAVLADVHGGIWGASRHALTVGFLSTMVFAIGQRVPPAFCGMRLLYSKGLMAASLTILNLGCLLRVVSEVPAYGANLRAAWQILPVSAVKELHLQLGAQRAEHVQQSAGRLLIFGAMNCEHLVHAIAKDRQFELEVLVVRGDDVLHDFIERRGLPVSFGCAGPLSTLDLLHDVSGLSPLAAHASSNDCFLPQQ